MKFMVTYASTEGQTQKIARWITDHLVAKNITVELTDAAHARAFDPARFDAVILAASVHVGHYQSDLVAFAAANAKALTQTPSLFLSVSLAAAGHDAEDWRQLDQILRDFKEATGWTPQRAEQIAGAYRPSQYDLFRRLIMRRIVAQKDPGIDLSADKEYTDWDGLRAILEEWCGSISD